MASGKRKTRRRQQQHHEQRRQLAMTSPPSRSRFGSPASSPGFIRPGAGGVLSHFIQECYGGRTAPGDEGKRFHGQSEEDEEPVHDEDQAPGTNQQLTPFSDITERTQNQKCSLQSQQRASKTHSSNTARPRRRSVKPNNTRAEELQKWKKTKEKKRDKENGVRNSLSQKTCIRKRKSVRSGVQIRPRNRRKSESSPESSKNQDKSDITNVTSEDKTPTTQRNSKNASSKTSISGSSPLSESAGRSPVNEAGESNKLLEEQRDTLMPLAKTAPMPEETVKFETPRRKKTRARSEPTMFDVPSTPATKMMVQQMGAPAVMDSPSMICKKFAEDSSYSGVVTPMDVNTLVKKLTATKMCRELLSAQARSLQAELKKSRALVKELKAKIKTEDRSPERALKSVEENQEISTKLFSDTEKMKELEAKSNQSDRELRELKSQLGEEKLKNQQLEEHLVKLKEDVELHKRRNESSTASNTALIARLAEAEERTESALSAAERAKEDSQEEMDKYDQKLRNVREEAQRSVAKINVLNQKIDFLRERRREEELVRRRLHNRIQDLLGRVRVFCRLRPPSGGQLNATSDYLCSVEDGAGVLELVQQCNKVSGGKRNKRNRFTFDSVFTQNTSQTEVFEHVGPLITSCMDGYNVTIFAYGQTGSGKTFTMFGPIDATPQSLPSVGTDLSEQRGMIPRSVDLIFNIIDDAKTKQWNYCLSVSILEIYNENIRDLLSKKNELLSKKNEQISHEIKVDRSGNCFVTNLRKVKIGSAEHLHRLTHQASEQASRSATSMNSKSSRAHTLFQLHIEGRNTKSKQTVQSVLSLVDLAGSERVSRTQAQGERFEEAKNINTSLSSLGTCVKALAENSNYVPYRNSKLTYLLHSALAGSGKTAFFVNISPDQDSVGESLCTLRFAESLKNVKCK